MVPHLFDLNSTWHLPAPPEQVWAIIADVDMSWPHWWPGCSFAAPLTRTESKSSSQEDVLKATTAQLNFKAFLGYTLTITIHPTSVDPPTDIHFDAGGHLEGIGRVTVSPEGAGRSRMDISWRVRPTQRWMNLMSPIAAPLFAAAHKLLMRQGEKGLIRTLSEQMPEGTS